MRAYAPRRRWRMPVRDGLRLQSYGGVVLQRACRTRLRKSVSWRRREVRLPANGRFTSDSFHSCGFNAELISVEERRDSSWDWECLEYYSTPSAIKIPRLYLIPERQGRHLSDCSAEATAFLTVISEIYALHSDRSVLFTADFAARNYCYAVPRYANRLF